jgi:beta-glucosidase
VAFRSVLIPFQRLGGAPKIDPNEAIRDAMRLAKAADIAVVVVGLNSDWESEGFDRPALDLPGKQNELIAAVASVNTKTVVAIQAVGFYILASFFH